MLNKHPEVVYTDLEEGAVLLHMGTKLYYSLNETGSAVWRWLDTASTVDELVQNMTVHYEIAPEQAAASVRRFLDELEKEELSSDDDGGATGSTTAESESANVEKRPFVEPQVLKHDEPLHDVVTNPFDPQLPLAE